MVDQNIPILYNFWKEVEHYRQLGIESHKLFKSPKKTIDVIFEEVKEGTQEGEEERTEGEEEGKGTSINGTGGSSSNGGRSSTVGRDGNDG